MQKKVYEDYEPISGGSICFAVATTLIVGFLVQSLNNETQKEPKEINPVPQKITNKTLPVKQANYWISPILWLAITSPLLIIPGRR